ncbi:hypothetical protein [Halovivax sp.]|uniref:hypothetical protein n=1 Tax=Halovivax sp. TaxID=1935978 RepID=UPI0025B864AA|nr:hypothetical protein [Halovivax sp.]
MSERHGTDAGGGDGPGTGTRGGDGRGVDAGGESRAVDWRSLAAVERLRYVAAGLAFAVAAIHLFHPDLGFLRLVELLAADPTLLSTHPRPLAFVLSAIAIIAGVNAVAMGAPRRPIYAAGMVLVWTYVLGYVAWHYFGHGAFLPGREAHHHDAPAHEMVVAHLAGDPWALAAILTELALFVLLAVLFVRDR